VQSKLKGKEKFRIKVEKKIIKHPVGTAFGFTTRFQCRVVKEL
jgi:hypothetical protein